MIYSNGDYGVAVIYSSVTRVAVIYSNVIKVAVIYSKMVGVANVQVAVLHSNETYWSSNGSLVNRTVV